MFVNNQPCIVSKLFGSYIFFKKRIIIMFNKIPGGKNEFGKNFP